jgi:C-terminal processing protease CtpA/Prc
MLNIKKAFSVVMSAVIISVSLIIPAGAYDYNDYLKDAAEVPEIYTYSERAVELAEVVTQTYPDYWEAYDKNQNLYDAVGALADIDDGFYEAFLDALMEVQFEYGRSDHSAFKYIHDNSQNIILQIEYTESITHIENLYGKVLEIVFTKNPEYFDKLIASILSFTDMYSSYVKGEEYFGGQDTDLIPVGFKSYLLGNAGLIFEVSEGSGAEAAGIKPGDIITAIDGEPYSYLTAPNTRGPENTVVELTIYTAEGETVTKTVKRIKYSTGRVTSKRIDDTVIIAFKEFVYLSDAEQFEKFYDEAAADPTVKKLVIDLRGNIGGQDDVLNKILSVLTPDNKQLYSLESRDKTETIRSEGRYMGRGKKFSGTLFVLTDNITASSADITTAVIRNIGGIQVGEPTYGKGIGQSGFVLHNGYMAWITGLIIDVPNFGKYNGTPIRPNVPVSVHLPMFSEGEVISDFNVTKPLTPESSKTQINAFKQRLSALTALKLPSDGKLDLRTMYFTNALRINFGLDPYPLTGKYSIDPETLRLISDFADSIDFANAKLLTMDDKALEYCLNYKPKAETKTEPKTEEKAAKKAA